MNMPSRRTLQLWTSVAIGTLVIIGLFQGFGWSTGFGGKATTSGYQPAKTLWDWMDLVIVPAALALGALWFTRQTEERDKRREQVEKTREAERREDEKQEKILQEYVEAMLKLFFTDLIAIKNDVGLGPAEEKALMGVARVRTVTALRRLDRARRQEIIEFLRDAGILGGEDGVLKDARMMSIDLSGALLIGANLTGCDLVLSKLENAILSGANLRGATLIAAELNHADLREAIVELDHLRHVNSLEGAIMPDKRIFSEDWFDTVEVDQDGIVMVSEFQKTMTNNDVDTT